MYFTREKKWIIVKEQKSNEVQKSPIALFVMMARQVTSCLHERVFANG